VVFCTTKGQSSSVSSSHKEGYSYDSEQRESGHSCQDKTHYLQTSRTQTIKNSMNNFMNNSMKSYCIIIEKASDNYSVFSPDVLGCISTGDTLEEALAMMTEALEMHLEAMFDDGEQIPEPRPLAEHIAEYRADGMELCEEGTLITFLPVERVVPEAARQHIFFEEHSVVPS
jgi:predicted RNase H-like HicB family nuclease